MAAVQIKRGFKYPDVGDIEEMNFGYSKDIHGFYICKDGYNMILNPESAHYMLAEVNVTS
jgi:hypothetical protein